MGRAFAANPRPHTQAMKTAGFSRQSLTQALFKNLTNEKIGIIWFIKCLYIVDRIHYEFLGAQFKHLQSISKKHTPMVWYHYDAFHSC